MKQKSLMGEMALIAVICMAFIFAANTTVLAADKLMAVQLIQLDQPVMRHLWGSRKLLLKTKE
jgi:hypothetical protein